MRLLLVVSAFVVLACAAAADAATTFVVTGRGWGHSVGMSQWGAYGLVAREPATTHAGILAHYYRGTQLAAYPATTVRVLLASGRSELTVGSSAPFTVGRKSAAAGSYRVTVTADGRVRVWGLGIFSSTARVSPGGAPLRLGASAYRGHLDLRVTGGRLSARNVLGSEAYLLGVVANEVPSTWFQAVLRAQAVAARSWLMRSLRPTQWFDVYPDTRSQVYRGLASERASTTEAVQATARQVLVHEGAVAQAFYHSSSGGRTASSADVWGGRVAYLQSVPDYDLIAANPHRFWRVVLSPRALAARLRTRVPRNATYTLDGSGLAQTVTVSGGGWATTVAGSETLRARLGVKSARFKLGVLKLVPSTGRTSYRKLVTLSAAVRDVASVVLQRKEYGGVWQTIGSVPAGSTSMSVRPSKTTWYRLAFPRGAAAAVRVRVAPRVNFTVEQAAGGLTGVVRPALAGAPVYVQRRSSGSWRRVATASVGSDGIFRARFTVRAGTYRAVVVPPTTSGFVAGTSPTLTVATG